MHFLVDAGISSGHHHLIAEVRKDNQGLGVTRPPPPIKAKADVMTFNSIIKPKAPAGHGWSYVGLVDPTFTNGYEGVAWRHVSQNLFVISALEVVYDEGIDKGPEYHVSISKQKHGRPRRCSSNEASFVIDAFGMDGAEEDNHVPYGVVRNFWLPVAESLIGMECPCKAEEPAIIEDKGDFVWRGT